MRSIKGAVGILAGGPVVPPQQPKIISIMTVIDFDDVASGTIKSQYQHRGGVGPSRRHLG